MFSNSSLLHHKLIQGIQPMLVYKHTCSNLQCNKELYFTTTGQILLFSARKKTVSNFFLTSGSQSTDKHILALKKKALVSDFQYLQSRIFLSPSVYVLEQLIKNKMLCCMCTRQKIVNENACSNSDIILNRTNLLEG